MGCKGREGSKEYCACWIKKKKIVSSKEAGIAKRKGGRTGNGRFSEEEPSVEVFTDGGKVVVLGRESGGETT